MGELEATARKYGFNAEAARISEKAIYERPDVVAIILRGNGSVNHYVVARPLAGQGLQIIDPPRDPVMIPIKKLSNVTIVAVLIARSNGAFSSVRGAMWWVIGGLSVAATSWLMVVFWRERRRAA